MLCNFFFFSFRYLLPKGKVGGQEYQLYVIVSPANQGSSGASAYSSRWYDSRPLGFPFNRPIDRSVFFVPNSYFQDVVIYNKNYDDMNASY